MIQKLKLEQLDEVMKIWLNTNISAHNFISREYWINNYEGVKQMLPEAEIYIFEENNIIKGFIGIVNKNYIGGLFVKEEYQRNGIGRKLLNYCKDEYKILSLNVFAKNERAANFYKNNDFIISAEGIDEATKELEYTMVYKK